jgi:hypothetical protein
MFWTFCLLGVYGGLLLWFSEEADRKESGDLNVWGQIQNYVCEMANKCKCSVCSNKIRSTVVYR